ncbi:MAG: YezD family protein [Capsulimonadales bacterium]|nr:YezD family protein [Capsulimonadales bacterium]
MYRTGKIAQVSDNPPAPPTDLSDTVKNGHPIPIEEIKAAIEKVRHGSVQLIIQDGRVVQIDIVEKRRLA